ncbi:replicative DNA helicase [Mesonia aquimarina]|uniref:replicative DNA helicase n=1 Tax=Mesonia aquimarina TaxID=1504967 RepID=UPI000EF60D42|nr:replicative DNA helicase [Mesonia aquimarina]
MQKGKIIPQAVDLEEVILGAMLIDEKGLDAAFAVISNPEVFYKNEHQSIFKAIKLLYESNSKVDLLTVSQKLKDIKLLESVGGDYYMIQLTQKVSSSAHLEYHCRIILQKFMAREVISLCNYGINLAYDSKLDVFDLIDSVSAKLDKVSDITAKGHTSKTWYDAISEVPKRVEFLTNNDGKITGVPTGINTTDKHFSGWQPTDLIVIGGDSGMGKTAYVMNTMLAASKQDISCGMFSMEMSVIQLAIRGIANESNYHMNQLMRNGFEKPEYFHGLLKTVEEMKNLPIHIDDQPALTVIEMKRKARMMKRKYNIEILVIDFIQMFSGDKDTRINIAEAAREAKNIAKELEIPVIALSQLSREVKRDTYKIPQKHHLRESSAIEDAADVIGLIYRPSVYGFSPESHPTLYEDLGLDANANACLIVVKNRNGSLGNVPMKYIENKTKYVNPYDESEQWNDSDIPQGEPGVAF